VYGFEQTKFNPDEISYIIKEFEDMQNQRLEENGYEPIDFQGMLELPEEEFEELVSTFDIPVVESNEAIQQEVESEEDEILDIQEKEQITNEAEYLESLTSDLYEL
jgi:DNA primase large subunit